MPNSSLVVPGGRPASTCLGIWSSESCHTSTCSVIRQSRGPRRSTCLDLPRDPVFGRLTCFSLPRDLISRELSCFSLPGDPIHRRQTCLDLPGDSISRRLSCLSLPGDLHPDPGTPGSQAATVLSRIRFKKTYPEGSPPMEIEGGLLVFSFFFSSLSSLSFRWEITNSLPNRCP